MNPNKKIFFFLIIAIILICVAIVFSTDEEKIEQVIQEIKPKPIPYQFHTIKKGESLYQVLNAYNVSNSDIADITIKLGEFVDMSNVQIGDKLKILTVSDSTGYVFKELVYQPDIITSHIIKNESLDSDSLALAYNKVVLPVERKRRLLKGKLENNLDQSLLKLGLEPAVKQEVNNALEAEVSFQTDARNGDIFEVFLEERFYNGEKLPRAKLLYASYDGARTKKHMAFRFEDDDETSALNGMYTESGKTLVQNSVRSPLNRLHISSAFGWRIHPISRRRSFHKGVDYRAGYGTPVYAVSSGRIQSAKSGYNGGWGKEIRIRHSNMKTQYAHLSRIYVRKGQYVKKGTKIGAVGSTGRSTGPHLHFGLMKSGRWINPKNLKMVGAVKLKKAKLKEFKVQMNKLKNEIKTYEAIEVANAEANMQLSQKD